MVAPGDCSVDLWHLSGITWGYVTYSTDKLMNYEWGWVENHPKQLKVILSNGDIVPTTENMLSSTFNKWSAGVTGAVDVGDMIAFSLCQTGASSLSAIFYGRISDIQPSASDRTVTLIADDLFNRYDGIKSDKLIFSHYIDCAIKATVWNDTRQEWEIQGITQTPIVEPMTVVKVAVDDKLVQTGTTDSGDQIVSSGGIAQPFTAQSDIITYVLVHYNTAMSCNYTIKLVEDGGAGTPTGAVLATATTLLLNGNGWGGIWWDGFTAPRVSKGLRYWIVITANYASANVRTDAAPTYPIPAYLYYSGGAWVTVSGSTLQLKIFGGGYKDVARGSYELVDADDKIYISEMPGSAECLEDYNYIFYNRALVSYYYGTVTASNIATALTGLDKPLITDTGQAVAFSSTTWTTKTYPIYRTKGRYIGDCIRELADNFCTSISGTYYQAAVAAYNPSNSPAGTNFLKWSRRLTTSDTSYRTLSTSSATDDELRIIATGTQLRKTTKRPASVMVVGQDSFGKPIVAHRDDLMLDAGGANASFRRKSGTLVTEYITDQGINTLQQADEIAKARLDMNILDSWEGEIPISGYFPDLMDIDHTSNTYGSGKIITLNIPELGIVAQKFKVKGVILTPATTKVQLTNYDVLTENKYNQAYESAKKTESFLGPTNADIDVFVKFSSGDATPATDHYMALLSYSGAVMTSRVLCKTFVDGKRDAITYHAEFEQGDGVSTDVLGTWVFRAALYTVAPGGSAWATQMLGDYYAFPKWTTTRVIVDFTVWDGT
jgi:hypothetical protein